jgi:hypothetical protein
MKIINKSRMAWTISALFFVAVTSCSKNEPTVQTPSSSQIYFTSEQAGLTVQSALNVKSDFVADAGLALKTTIHGNVTWWTALTDKTGIYSTEARTAPSAGGTLGILNGEYIANTTGPSSTFTATAPMYWGVASTLHNFYAYYPYNSNAPVPEPAASTVPVGLLSTQSQLVVNDDTHIGPLDFLVATPIAVISPANTDATTHQYVHLTYNHLFSVIEFNIAGTGTISGIRLTGTDLALAGSVIDIKQVTPAPGVPYTLADQGSKASAVIVNLVTPTTLTAIATDTKIYMVILPGYAGTCSIDFTSDGTTWKNLVSKAAPAGGFLRGQKYISTVNAGAIL